MRGNKQSTWSVTISLFIVIIGLFLVCAQQRSMVSNGDDGTAQDDQFKQELSQLLDLSQDSLSQQQPPSEDQTNTVLIQSADTTTLSATQDDVLSLLMPDEEKTENVVETQKPSQKDEMALSPQMFAQVRDDVSELEKRLERRNSMVDSLKQIIDNRNSHIQELEKQVAGPKPGKSSRIRPKASSANMALEKNSDFNANYKSARDQFELHKYQIAADAFQKLLSEYPNDKMADNCQYWIGECYFAIKDYQKAIIEFQKVFAYSEKDKHDDAQLMIGLCYVRSGQKDKAQKEFETFLDNYGTSEYASIAKKYYRSI